MADITLTKVYDQTPITVEDKDVAFVTQYSIGTRVECFSRPHFDVMESRADIMELLGTPDA